MGNTMTEKEYIKEHIIWGLLLFVWGKNLFFRCLPNCTYMESMLSLLGIAICVMGSGIYLTWKWGKNYINMLSNIIMTWGIFVIAAYMDVYQKRIIIFSLIAVIISIVLTLFSVCRRFERPEKRKRIIRIRRRNVITLWRRSFTGVCLFLLVPLAVTVFLHGTFLNADVPVSKVYGDEHGLKANIEEIADIVPERWGNLDVQRKLDVCQKIVNCEARYLGISHEVAIGTSDLPEGNLAHYNEANHQIVIDIDYLTDADGYDVLDTLIHECTHAYQYEQVALYKKVDEKSRNLLMFYDASVYLEEFSNYVDGNEDFQHYYSQKAEMDARRAGETESEVYIKIIEEYLSGVE